MTLRFSEEIILLLLDQEAGGLLRVEDRQLHLVLAGATLMDLALEDRIDTDLEQLVVLDPSPLNDPLLDPTLAQIAESAADSIHHSTAEWVQRVAEQGASIRDLALERLVASRILESAEDGLQFLRSDVARSRLYPAADGSVQEEVFVRIMRLLHGDDLPSPRDIVIVSLMRACGQFKAVLTDTELARFEPRISLISQLDVIGRVVSDAIRDLASKPTVEPPIEERAIPEARGLPFLGIALNLAKDPVAFMAECYRDFGPVFRVRLFGRSITVLAGREANEFVARNGHVCLTSHWLWQPFLEALGSRRAILTMSGKEHLRLRRAYANGYNRSALERSLTAAVRVVDDEVSAWQPGTVLRPGAVMQRIVFQQIATSVSGYSAREYMPDILFFVDTLLTAVFLGIPIHKLRPFRMRQASRRIDELYARVIESHRNRKQGEAGRYLIDMIIDVHRSDPELMPETDLKDAVIAPFLAGVDTVGNVCAFMLYELLKRPEVLSRVRDEVDAVLTDDVPTAAQLRGLTVTHQVVMETNRLHPVGPLLVRDALNSFSFDGHKVPAGSRVWLAPQVPHFLADVYRDPEKFDIDRYTPERAEHRQRFAYAPFGVGHHRCLGSGLAEALATLTLGLIVRDAELELLPADYELGKSFNPTPSPDSKFRARFVRHRRPRDAR